VADQVVIRGNERLRPGQPLRVAKPGRNKALGAGKDKGPEAAKDANNGTTGPDKNAGAGKKE
ncbi:MAG: hypothetical protein GY778_31890, partial [bacterium]|nr:hypothetical protein [bacterium]